MISSNWQKFLESLMLSPSFKMFSSVDTGSFRAYKSHPSRPWFNHPNNVECQSLWSKAWVCSRSLAGIAGFESHRGHGHLLSVVCCQVEVLRQPDRSSREVLPSLVRLSMITETHWGGLGNTRAVTKYGVQLGITDNEWVTKFFPCSLHSSSN